MQQTFIDCVAINNVLPAPLVIFATFVGFHDGNMDGGIGYASIVRPSSRPECSSLVLSRLSVIRSLSVGKARSK